MWLLTAARSATQASLTATTAAYSAETENVCDAAKIIRSASSRALGNCPLDSVTSLGHKSADYFIRIL